MRTVILICTALLLPGCSERLFDGGSDDSPILVADSGSGTLGVPADRLRQLNIPGNYYSVCYSSLSVNGNSATIHDSSRKLRSFEVVSPSPMTYKITSGQKVTLMLSNTSTNSATSTDLQTITISFANGTWNTAIPNTAVNTDGALKEVDLDIGAGPKTIYMASGGSSFEGCFHYTKKGDGSGCSCSQ